VGCPGELLHANQIASIPCLEVLRCAVTLCQSTRRIVVSYYTLRKFFPISLVSKFTDDRATLSCKTWPSVGSLEIHCKRNKTHRFVRARGIEAVQNSRWQDLLASSLRNSSHALLPAVDAVHATQSCMSSTFGAEHEPPSPIYLQICIAG
jgi:hypothetical protein